MTRKLWWMALTGALVALLGIMGACGDDDDDDGGSEEDKTEAADTMEQVVEAGPDEIDFYLEHTTDNFLVSFGTDAAGCEQAPEECASGTGTATTANVEIDGDEATMDLTVSDSGEESAYVATMVKEDDVWKAEKLSYKSDELAAGVKVIDLELGEFFFKFEPEDIDTGNIGLHVTNAGEQVHEASLVEIPEDADVDELLQSENPDITPIKFALPINPGDEVDVGLPAELEPGRYLFACFFPDTDDPERTPHVFKGMQAEFTIE